MKQLIKNILKEYSINEGIKPHPKEEEFKKYQDVIDSIVYGIVNEDDLCGYKTEFFLNSGEDALQIVLYYKKGRYPGYDVFSEKRIEIKNTLEKYLPIIEMAFVAYDSTRCEETIKENKDTEIEKNLKVINTLLSQVNWKGLCDIWVEYNETDGDYEIRSKYVSEGFYYGDDYFSELEFLDNTIKSMGLRIYIFSPWFVDSCDDEVEFINENKDTEIEKNLKVINTLLSLVSWDGLCDIWVEYNPTDMEYEIRSKTTESYFGDNDIEQELESLENSLRSMGIICYIYHPYYVENCEDEVRFLNESENKKEKKFNTLLQNIENHLNSNDYPHVKKITLDYFEPNDSVNVNVFYYYKDAIRLGEKINRIIGDTGGKIMEDLKMFPLKFGYYIHFDKELNESKEEGDKKKSLIKNIRNIGLYDFIRMTGLSLEEVQSQVEKIPREMLEQFIKDYISNKGLPYSSHRPDEKIVTIDTIVGGNAIIDFIYYDGKVLSFEVTEYANGFSKEDTDQYIEGSKNYGYNTIFKIVEKIIRKIS